MELTESFEKTITSENIERWRYPRFFSKNISLEDKTAYVSGEDEKHISQVLRMKKGDKAIICDGGGADHLCAISAFSADSVCFDILDRRINSAEANVALRLFQCLPKSDKMEFIIQKATELGAAEIIPVISARCVANPDSKKRSAKIVRYRKIAEEAAKQCGRGKIPMVGDFISFSDAIAYAGKNDLNLFFYECGGKKIKNILTQTYPSVNILIGPEGGFTQEEAALAAVSGFHPVTLGPRILRCETAPVAAISIIMNLTNNM